MKNQEHYEALLSFWRGQRTKMQREVAASGSMPIKQWAANCFYWKADDMVRSLEEIPKLVLWSNQQFYATLLKLRLNQFSLS